MELMFDNANLETLTRFAEIYPYVGVTSNPTIIKAESKLDFFAHMKNIRALIGKEHSLHIQVVSTNAADIVKEANKIAERIDKDVYIKIPVTEEGLKAIKILKAKNFKITATAIYTKIQGLLATAAGADYIAPYFNRIEKRGENPSDIIAAFRADIDFGGASTKILAASFHSGEQVLKALHAGADCVTLQPKLLQEMLCADYIDNAVNVFAQDWKNSQGFENLLDCE